MYGIESTIPTPIKVKRLSASATLPMRATAGAAAYDLYSNQAVVIEPGKIVKLKLGVAIEVPSSFFVYVRPRSGLASNQGGDLCSSGIVDSDYRGEVHMPLINHGQEPIEIKVGDRVGQMVVLPVPYTEIVECDELSSTERGAGGFGSTGTR